MIMRYRKYLEIIDQKIARMFEAQKPFIKCQKGCAYCCKEGEYPVSELEYINMMFCYNNLDEESRSKINLNISNLLESERTKMYVCPFLVNDSCAIYPARALICRTFGLLSHDNKGKNRMPFCVNLGLNYASVYDNDSKMLVRNADDGTEPLSYNITRPVLRSTQIEQDFNIFFGEDKPLIEWLAEDFK